MTTENILTLAEMQDTYTSISEHKGIDRLSLNFIPAKQDSFHKQLLNTLLNHPDNKDYQKAIAYLCFHFIRFGHTRESQNNYFEILTFCKDTEACQTHDATQQTIFNIFFTLSTTRHENNPNIQLQSQKEISTFINSKIPTIANKTTLCFIDPTTNNHYNILTITNSPQNNILLTQLIKNINNLLLDGPKTYSKLCDTSSPIPSEYILTKFLNQFAHGPLGLFGENQSLALNQTILNTIETLITAKPNTETLSKADSTKKTNYFNILNSSASKALYKYAENLKNHLKNPDQSSIPGNLSSDDFIKTIQTTLPLLAKISSPKLSKSLPEIITSLEIFS